ncbi:Lipid-A-disaccharide synthase [hydrothermal vent metagenome]|uniref:lipid-A-disaccharide synthase n=1 Tax=hydrothermal vent metagenome TaxID=652676 RepID=A0A3B0YUY6_9ZZZZ
MRIGIVAGEASGDLLGSGLIHAIKKQHPDAIFVGIGGPLMEEAGCKSLFPMERLSVMGLVEVLGRLRELFAIRSSLVDYFTQNRPDFFIGIDAPDFNIGLECKLKQRGIRTIHYVSPSVWAWRGYRIHKIARSVDLMLTLFPFEAKFYKESGVPVAFVGHPLADQIDLKPNQSEARDALLLPQDRRIVALLPGSRSGEINRLARPFLEAAQLCFQQQPDLHFVVPLVSEKTKNLFERIVAEEEGYGQLPLTVYKGNSRQVMLAADAILMASGTATLEAALLKKPMVVAYRVAPVTYWIARFLVKLPYFSLPNLLASKPLVDEFLQEDVTAQKLSEALLLNLDSAQKAVIEMGHVFEKIHLTLRQDASKRAAEAILSLSVQ